MEHWWEEVKGVILVVITSVVLSAAVSALVTMAHFHSMDNYMECLTERIEELIRLAGAAIERKADTSEGQTKGS